MPTYTFMNAEAGIEYDVTMPISEYDDYIKYINEVDENGYIRGDVGYNRSTTLLRSLKQLIRSEEYRLTRIPEDKMDLIMDIVSERKSDARTQLINNHIRLARIFKRWVTFLHI